MSDSRQVVRVGAEQAARFLTERAGVSVSARSVLAWAARGKIPHLRVVGRLVFDLDELAAWLNAGHTGPTIPDLYANGSMR